ncbi:MAG: 4-(cytidine 5'-diphospho)-2-C-methyl-D-erythritol kinase [Gammaproteobacteria bacterium]|nr:4-(cytidine 5'-diphospho)-2-C-methyl-D-erythritol kinase [Gammaproteobacteria bacterium]
MNLYLHVRARRADGMHELDTHFQFLDFADKLQFDIGARGIRRMDRHDFELPGDDLCVRAAKLLRAEVGGGERGAVITLHKIIPPGSGLGGGSSNAATTLLALNQLWKLNLPRARLAELALQLGADVPLFVHGDAARAGGVGEKLAPAAADEKWLCLCLPPVAVSTARVFANWRPGDTEKTAEQKNDLENAATGLYPEVADALARMRRHADARMSGSGGAVYARFDTRAQAERAAAQLPEIPSVITRSRNIHPLRDLPPA